MRRLLAAIAAIASAARSVLKTTWSFCTETGKWVSTTVASIGGGSAPSIPTDLQDLEAEMADDPDAPAAVVLTSPAVGGDSYDRIQRACLDINCGQQPSKDDWETLSALQREWLQELTPSMRLLVGNIERERLVAHLKGGKGLKGVLRCDAESVAGWKRASAIDALIDQMDACDPELASAPRLAI